MSVRENLESALYTLISFSASLDLSQPKVCQKQLQEKYPLSDPFIQNILQWTQTGIQEGWICHRENGGIRFSRFLKPESNPEKFSVDAVLMTASGPKHTHPLGEVDLCFALEGTPSFDQNKPGWTVYPPNSTHIPTVEGGKMLILYLLPEGQITFHASA